MICASHHWIWLNRSLIGEREGKGMDIHRLKSAKTAAPEAAKVHRPNPVSYSSQNRRRKWGRWRDMLMKRICVVPIQICIMEQRRLNRKKNFQKIKNFNWKFRLFTNLFSYLKPKSVEELKRNPPATKEQLDDEIQKQQNLLEHLHDQVQTGNRNWVEGIKSRISISKGLNPTFSRIEQKKMKENPNFVNIFNAKLLASTLFLSFFFLLGTRVKNGILPKFWEENCYC